MNKPVTFTTSGTVQAQEGTYLKRQADEDLLKLCRQGRYAYILTSRQMGKSSLMVATAERLQAEGIQTAIVDLQPLGAQTTTADKWYIGVLTALARKLRLLPDLMTWWEANQHLSEVQRMVQFLEEVVLTRVDAQIVVFIDEIDSTLSLDFTDDFFIALRYCYTARAENPHFQRLSFVLIGVATPSELIADRKRTPFNIGTLVELTDFTEPEARLLAAGLGLPDHQGQQVLQWVLQWTQGHPYLTQRVCQEVLQQSRQDWSEVAVRDLIGQLFLGDKREQDNNLQFVRDLLIRRAPDKDVLGVLGTYREVRRERQPVYDEDQSILKAHLKLSGVVKRVGSRLEVRNPIYREVFDLQWIREQWPETWWERLKPAMPLIAGLTAGIVGLGTLSMYALEQRNEANTQTKRAEDALARAEVEKKKALDAQLNAETQALEAKAAKQEAEKQKGIALEQQEIAEIEALIARVQTKIVFKEVERNFRSNEELRSFLKNFFKENSVEDTKFPYDRFFSFAREYDTAMLRAEEYYSTFWVNQGPSYYDDLDFERLAQLVSRDCPEATTLLDCEEWYQKILSGVLSHIPPSELSHSE